MRTHSSASSQLEHAAASALDQLLGIEHTAAARLAAAEHEAAKLIEQARADAAEAGAAADRRIEMELAEITRAAQSERSSAVAEIERQAAHDVQRYDALPTERIADRLVASILETTSGGAA